ncbi:MAG: hypothetical protein QXX68_01140 [Candidatus Pacearchaeota archaeon]
MRNKRGQAVLFIILGIILLFSVFLFFFIKPEVIFSKKSIEDPSLDIRSCILDSIKKHEENFFKEKQFLEEFKVFYVYRGERVPFSCFTSEFYFPCVQQSPLFIESVRRKIENKVSRDLSRCLLTIKENYDKKGYSFLYEDYSFNLIFEEKQISFDFKTNIHLSKGESSLSISNLKGNFKSSLPALLRTAETINNYESTFCEFDLMVWQAMNRDVKIDRFRGGDSTKVYILNSAGDSKKEIKFAIRTCVMPAGI